MENRSWLKNVGVGLVENGWGYSVLRTLKLAVCKGKIFGVLVQIHESFWVAVVKNGCGHLGLGTLKSAVSRDPIDEMNWFFLYWYKFGKGKSYFNNY